MHHNYLTVQSQTLDDKVVRLVIGHIHDMSNEEFDKIITTINSP
jgi:hypothetical protein